MVLIDSFPSLHIFYSHLEINWLLVPLRDNCLQLSLGINKEFGRTPAWSIHAEATPVTVNRSFDKDATEGLALWEGLLKYTVSQETCQ